MNYFVPITGDEFGLEGRHEIFRLFGRPCFEIIGVNNVAFAKNMNGPTLSDSEEHESENKDAQQGAEKGFPGRR